MKIISGIYKGRNLKGFDLKGTRPTMDRVKESLFAIIQSDIRNSVILDLFSGSGNLGIEALSEGAKKIYLVDNNHKAISIIKENLSNLDVSKDKYDIRYLNYQKALKEYGEGNLKFDLIFLDPPYDTDYIEKSLLLIGQYNLLHTDGIIICESNSLDKIPTPKIFEKIKEKKYGDKYIVLLKKI